MSKVTDRLENQGIINLARQQFESEKRSKLPSVIVSLASAGKIYPKNHVLRDGIIEMRYMTAYDEDVLTNASYIREGVVFDKLLELYNNIPKYTCTFNIDLYIQLFEKHFNQSKIKKTYLDLAPFSFHFEPFVQSELNHLVYLIQKDMENILKLKLDPEVKCAIEQKSKSKLKYIIKHIIYNLD